MSKFLRIFWSSYYPFFLFRIRIFLDFSRLFTLLFALIFRRLCSYSYHSADPFPDFLHLHYVYASTRTRHPSALCDNLAISTAVNPFSTRRWLGTTAGTYFSCVLRFHHDVFSVYTYVRTSFSGLRRCVCVSLILIRRARSGISSRMFVWVCVNAPT